MNIRNKLQHIAELLEHCISYEIYNGYLLLSMAYRVLFDLITNVKCKMRKLI